ncbi:uncharacterized protein SEPMUDRAFT_144072 [Sphaerulina musiva SO2202]|uniref:Tat pathway signal sequence n=1 Tax=Sphaerulina musiva (strain SO2202) TaxID=692275 RepID=N1QGT4_SPHMS|nr:uncharacterized protein SEPMUDRAFT_144072 [Sphaerulina musiva SO2202]EMF09214.1 hypothetical protein SEPMUDRAFT_144072 [Sphaerulina musiva SO2202]
MNATLLPSPTDQIFRDDPSPEVDRAWRRISNEQPIALSKEEVIALGKDPSEAVQYPESFGLGESYAGRIDVFHQIHCLDALRREAHWNYYYASKYPDLEHSTKLHQVHLSHCIYYLLQNIMCQASVDVYTHVWTDSLLQPFPDFNTTKTCRNFDAVLNWQERNGVGLEEFYKLRKPREFEGMWIMEEAFKDVWREFEWWNPEGERMRDGTKTG